MLSDGTCRRDNHSWSRTINSTYSSDYTVRARSASVVRRTEVGAGWVLSLASPGWTDRASWCCRIGTCSGPFGNSSCPPLQNEVLIAGAGCAAAVSMQMRGTLCSTARCLAAHVSLTADSTTSFIFFAVSLKSTFFQKLTFWRCFTFCSIICSAPFFFICSICFLASSSNRLSSSSLRCCSS